MDVLVDERRWNKPATSDARVHRFHPDYDSPLPLCQTPSIKVEDLISVDEEEALDRGFFQCLRCAKVASSRGLAPLDIPFPRAHSKTDPQFPGWAIAGDVVFLGDEEPAGVTHWVGVVSNEDDRQMRWFACKEKDVKELRQNLKHDGQLLITTKTIAKHRPEPQLVLVEEK